MSRAAKALFHGHIPQFILEFLLRFPSCLTHNFGISPLKPHPTAKAARATVRADGVTALITVQMWRPVLATWTNGFDPISAQPS